MVEDIESFHSQLAVERLRDTGKTNIFDEGKIHIALDIQAKHLPAGAQSRRTAFSSAPKLKAFLDGVSGTVIFRGCWSEHMSDSDHSSLIYW